MRPALLVAIMDLKHSMQTKVRNEQRSPSNQSSSHRNPGECIGQSELNDGGKRADYRVRY